MDFKPKSQIESIAKSVGFEKIDFQENIGLISFKDKENSIRVNVYMTKMTVVIQFKDVNKTVTKKRVDLDKLKTTFEYLSEVSKREIKLTK